MQTIRAILADNSTSISELKRIRWQWLSKAMVSPVAVLNRDQPAFYSVLAAAYEIMMDKLEDIELAALVEEREDQSEIEVYGNVFNFTG